MYGTRDVHKGPTPTSMPSRRHQTEDCGAAHTTRDIHTNNMSQVQNVDKTTALTAAVLNAVIRNTDFGNLDLFCLDDYIEHVPEGSHMPQHHSPYTYKTLRRGGGKTCK